MGHPEKWSTGSPDASLIDLRRLQVFVSAARSLSFAACAQQLGLTPSAVSHAIRSLEEDLSCTLFQRHGPRVTLTRTGIRLLPIAGDLLVQMQGLRSEVALIEDELRQLRVIAPEVLCTSLLPRVLPSFFECFPGVRFEVISSSGDEEAVSRMGERTADLYLSLSAEMAGDFVKRQLFVEEFGVFIAPFHPLARFPRVETRELARHTLLVPQGGVLEALAARGLADSGSGSRVWLLPSIESARDFARVGLGAAVLPSRCAAEATESGALRQVQLSAPRIVLSCSAFWPGQTQLSWTAEAFLSLVQASGE